MQPLVALLLPGMDGSGQLFGPLLEALPPWIKGVPLSYPTGAARYDDIEPLVLAEVERHRPAVLLAESFSGPLALRVAARKPKALEAVVLVATFLACPRPELAFLRPLVMPAMFTLTPPGAVLRHLMLATDTAPELLDQLVRVIRAVPAQVMAERLRQVIDVDARPLVARCPVPLVVVEARRDRLVPPGLGEAVRASAGAAVHPIAVDGPHLLLQCRAREVIEAVGPVLKKGLDRGAS